MSEKSYLPRRKLPKRYGVTEMTVWRWERDPLLGFPDPLVVNGKKFYAVAALEAWEMARMLTAPASAPPKPDDDAPVFPRVAIPALPADDPPKRRHHSRRSRKATHEEAVLTAAE